MRRSAGSCPTWPSSAAVTRLTVVTSPSTTTTSRLPAPRSCPGSWTWPTPSTSTTRSGPSRVTWPTWGVRSRWPYAVRWPPASSPGVSSPSTSHRGGEGAGTARRPTRKTRRVVLHVHLSHAAIAGTDHADQVGRVENTRSPVTAEQIRDWCGHPDADLIVKPVIDLDDHIAVDAYEIPDRIKEAVALRDHACVFPWCTRPARTLQPDSHPCDCDHVEPWRDDGRRPPDLLLLTRAAVPHPPPTQDPLRLALHHPRPRHLPLVIPPRLPVPPRPPRHPRRHTTNWPAPTTMTPPHTPH